MGNEEAKNEQQLPQSNSDKKEETPTLESVAAELESIKISLKKRKSETTTLKILFYTSLAVLLFGFFYTNQTLQRAQLQNLESNISLLQNRLNHTLILLDRKLHHKINNLETKLSGLEGPGFHENILSMNQVLNELEPQNTSQAIMIEQLQRNSNELSQMVREQQNQEEISSTQ